MTTPRIAPMAPAAADNHAGNTACGGVGNRKLETVLCQEQFAAIAVAMGTAADRGAGSTKGRVGHARHTIVRVEGFFGHADAGVTGCVRWSEGHRSVEACTIARPCPGFTPLHACHVVVLPPDGSRARFAGVTPAQLLPSVSVCVRLCSCCHCRLSTCRRRRGVVPTIRNQNLRAVRVRGRSHWRLPRRDRHVCGWDAGPWPAVRLVPHHLRWEQLL